jgi:hypothetical protein
MKIMATHTSATTREDTPHIINSTEPNGKRYIANVYRRRAESVINDRTIDSRSRALIRYALETNDPWLAALVRRIDAGKPVDTMDFSQEPQVENDFEVDKIETLAEMICRGGDEPDTKSAALLVLMASLEDSPHPKALANTVKHLAFYHCAERNLCGMIDAEIRVIQAELFAGKAFVL